MDCFRTIPGYHLEGLQSCKEWNTRRADVRMIQMREIKSPAMALRLTSSRNLEEFFMVAVDLSRR